MENEYEELVHPDYDEYTPCGEICMSCGHTQAPGSGVGPLQCAKCYSATYEIY